MSLPSRKDLNNVNRLDLFQNGSTYQNDYIKLPFPERRSNCIKDRVEKPPPKLRNFIYTDNETYAKWRTDVHIPFDLLTKPNEITRHDPYKPFCKPKVEEKRQDTEVIKTRPRIYMSPAISMDDIPDLEMRRLLCKNMYTSMWTKASEETKIHSEKKHVSNTTIEENGNPVQFQLELWPPINKEHKKNAKKWQVYQSRATVDPTCDFWTHRDSVDKSAAAKEEAEELVSQKINDQIRHLIAVDRLRLAHDDPIPGYTGYRPRMSYGVTLEKSNFPVVHPFISVTQSTTKRYAEDMTDHEKQEN